MAREAEPPDLTAEDAEKNAEGRRDAEPSANLRVFSAISAVK
jgi:hypothetical protein